MEDKNQKEIFEYKELVKKQRRFWEVYYTRRAIVVILTILAGIGLNILGRNIMFDHSLRFLGIDGMGTVFVAATCSYMPALLTVIVSHVVFNVLSQNAFYGGLGHLICAIIIAACTRKQWLKDFKKTAVLTVISSLIAGTLTFCFVWVTEGITPETAGLGLRFLGTLVPNGIMLMITAIYVNMAPKKLILLYPNGVYYRLDPAGEEAPEGSEKTYLNEIRRFRENSSFGIRQRPLSSKITLIIAIVSVVLCLSAVTISNYLYYDLTKQHLDRIRQNGEMAPPGNLNGVITPSGNLNGVITPSGIRYYDNLQINKETDIREAFDIKENKDFDFRLVVLLSMIAVFVALLANFYAQLKVARPIKRISEAMQSFAFGSRDDAGKNARKIHKLNIRTGDEIEELYLALDKTTSEMNEYMKKVEEEQELEAELKVAKASSEAKSSFLSNMSHEIRTPINAVLGMDEMIIRESSEPQIVEYAANLRDAGRTLLGLINDILDFSKIEAGKLEIIPVEYDLSSVVNDLVNMITTKAQDKGLELIVDVDETMPHYLYGDEIRLKQVILNILTNAVKYTEKGSVRFTLKSVKRDDEHIDLSVSVKDTGIGIKQEDIEKLFSPFERIEEERNRTIEGTGLGMNIVKMLLALMDSKLEVESVYGEGSEFSFTVAQKVVNWAPIGDLTERLKEAHSREKTYREAFHAPDAHVLVVDDTPMNLTVMEGYLKNTKIKIDTAQSGPETLELVKQKKYDCIFLDHRMPVMDGVETFRNMKTLEGNLNTGTPVVALTANAVSGARESYMAEGFTDYLSKPVDPLRLEALLMELLPEEKLERYTVTDEIKPETDEEAIGAKLEDNSGLPEIEGTDRQEALKASGSPEVLIKVTKQFAMTVPTKTELIRRLWESGNIRDYTIEVHALKSSARLIGAMDLSRLAAELEDAGNEENIEKINAKTPALLYDYGEFNDRLAFLLKDEGEDQKEAIDPDTLKEGLEALREMVSAFDFDSADMCLAELAKYRIPEEKQKDFEELKVRLAEVDSDGVIETIEKML